MRGEECLAAIISENLLLTRFFSVACPAPAAFWPPLEQQWSGLGPLRRRQLDEPQATKGKLKKKRWLWFLHLDDRSRGHNRLTNSSQKTTQLICKYLNFNWWHCLPALLGPVLQVPAQFNPQNNFGNTQIIIDGQNLLLGNGFHIIGSKSGFDNDDNIDSESPNNRNGIMRSQRPSGGTLPYSMTFSRNPHDNSRLLFTVSVGPSSDSFKALSVPLECQMGYFSYGRSSSSSAIRRYDQNPPAYANPSDPTDVYYIDWASGIPQWGEIIGAEYTIRVTIAHSSVPMPLYFVNAPKLATGDRDVEFGFPGGVASWSCRHCLRLYSGFSHQS